MLGAYNSEKDSTREPPERPWSVPTVVNLALTDVALKTFVIVSA